MIRLNAKINIDSAYNKISDVNTTATPIINNISAEMPPINRVSNGSRPFYLGFTKFKEMAKFSPNNVDYFIAKQQEVGGFNFELVITATNPIETLNITFDRIGRIYPTKITETITNKVYRNDDAQFNVSFSKSTNKVQLKFENMNRANAPLIIYGVTVGLIIDINIKNMIDLKITHKDRADNDKPSYGIISNGGNLSFVDSDDEIKDYIEQKLLKSNQLVTISMKDTISNKEEIVGKYYTGKWGYENNNKIVDVELKEDLVNWQDILLDDVPLDYSLDNMQKLLQKLIDKIPNISNNYENLASDYLQNIQIKYPYMDKGSLWNTIQKVCDVCGLHIYKKNNGKIAIDNDYNV